MCTNDATAHGQARSARYRCRAASASTAACRSASGPPSGPSRGVQSPLAFSTVNILSMARLYGRAGRLTAQNGGFRPARAVPAGKVREGGRRHVAHPIHADLVCAAFGAGLWRAGRDGGGRGRGRGRLWVALSFWQKMTAMAARLPCKSVRNYSQRRSTAV